MSKETPPIGESKENIISFEEFKKKIEEYATVVRQAHMARNSTRAFRQWNSAGEKITGHHGKPDKWQNIPEMADLFAEEQDLVASGVSDQEIKEYSTLYQRAYERAQKLEDKRQGLIDDRIVDLAGYYASTKFHKDLGFKELSEEELQAIFNAVTEDIKSNREGNEAERFKESPEFKKALDGAERAKKFMGMRQGWEHAQKQLKEGGFESPEDMFADAMKQFAAIRKEVGEEKFKQLMRRIFVREDIRGGLDL